MTWLIVLLAIGGVLAVIWAINEDRSVSRRLDAVDPKKEPPAQ